MKKNKLLTTPTKLEYLHLHDLDYNVAPLREGKTTRLAFRRWRKLRQQSV
jgi:hypothetical protein